MSLYRSRQGAVLSSGNSWVSVADSLIVMMILLVAICLSVQDFASQRIKTLKEGERGRVSPDEHQKMLKAKEVAENDLAKAKQALKEEQTKAASLARDLAAKSRLADELAKKLEGAGVDKDKLTGDLTKLTAEIVALKKALGPDGKLQTDLAAALLARTRLEKELKTAEARKAELESELRVAQSEVRRLGVVLATKTREVDLAAAEVSRLKGELVSKTREVEQAKVQAEKARNEADEVIAATLLKNEDLLKRMKSRFDADLKISEKERENLLEQMKNAPKIHKALLGLEGDLKRIAIIFDRSGSMDHIEPGKPSRWKLALETVKTWVSNLDFDECVLIVFNHEVKVYPEQKDAGGKGVMYKIGGLDPKSKDAVRAEMLKALNDVSPEGQTNTLEALQRAYSFNDPESGSPLTAIILMTDGQPYVGDTTTDKDKIKEVSGKMQEACVKLCGQNPGIRVNAIGLGQYYTEKSLYNFLDDISRKTTGGAFLGR